MCGTVRYKKYMHCVWIIVLLTVVEAEVNIVSKTNWNGDESGSELTPLALPVARVIISHTAGADCVDMETCAQQTRNIQRFHMNSLKFDDVAYNFLIGNDGNVYEGRGWSVQGAHTRGYNAGSLGFSFIGNFEKNLPTDLALEAAKSLLSEGVRLGHITEDYKLFGHRQFLATSSPGDALYDEIKQWPNWSRKIN